MTSATQPLFAPHASTHVAVGGARTCSCSAMRSRSICTLPPRLSRAGRSGAANRLPKRRSPGPRNSLAKAPPPCFRAPSLPCFSAPSISLDTSDRRVPPPRERFQQSTATGSKTANRQVPHTCRSQGARHPGLRPLATATAQGFCGVKLVYREAGLV